MVEDKHFNFNKVERMVYKKLQTQMPIEAKGEAQISEARIMVLWLRSTWPRMTGTRPNSALVTTM